MSYMNGLTDGPPHVLTARQIAQQWHDLYYPQANRWQSYDDGWRLSDGSIVDHLLTIDLDYRMGYLLRVQPPNHGEPDAKLDHLAVYTRHAGPDCVEAAEWRQQPVKFFDQTLDDLEEHLVWCAHWVMARDRGEW